MRAGVLRGTFRSHLYLGENSSYVIDKKRKQ